MPPSSTGGNEADDKQADSQIEIDESVCARSEARTDPSSRVTHLSTQGARRISFGLNRMRTPIDFDPSWSETRIVLHDILTHRVWKAGMAIVIVITIIMVVLETDARARSAGDNVLLRLVAVLLLLVYVVEISLRLFVERRRFFKEFWNVFDFCLVVSDVLSTILEGILGGNMPSVAFLRVLRIGRIVRIFKVFLEFPELSMLINGTYSAMRSIFWAAIMILIVLVMWSIVTVELINPLNQELAESGAYDGCERCGRAFETVAQATLTYIQTVVAGDSWGVLAMPMIERHPATAFLLMAVLLTVDLGLLNLVLAVIVDRAVEARAQDTEQLIKAKADKFNTEKKRLFKICSTLDKEQKGLLTKEDLLNGFDEVSEFAEMILLMDIAKKDLDGLFEIWDQDGSNSLSYKEFVEQIYITRSNDSNALLVSCVQAMQRNFGSRIDELQRRLLRRVDKQDKYISELTDAFAEFVVASGVPPLSPTSPAVNSKVKKPMLGAAVSPMIDPLLAQEANLGIDELKRSIESFQADLRADLDQLARRLDVDIFAGSTAAGREPSREQGLPALEPLALQRWRKRQTPMTPSSMLDKATMLLDQQALNRPRSNEAAPQPPSSLADATVAGDHLCVLPGNGCCISSRGDSKKSAVSESRAVNAVSPVGVKTHGNST